VRGGGREWVVVVHHITNTLYYETRNIIRTLTLKPYLMNNQTALTGGI